MILPRMGWHLSVSQGGRIILLLMCLLWSYGFKSLILQKTLKERQAQPSSFDRRGNSFRRCLWLWDFRRAGFTPALIAKFVLLKSFILAFIQHAWATAVYLVLEASLLPWSNFCPGNWASTQILWSSQPSLPSSSCMVPSVPSSGGVLNPLRTSLGTPDLIRREAASVGVSSLAG